ncbi:MAG: phosphoribosylformylglycinamidine synthase subunit PurS, partial [Desulfobacterales bacterium]|nr:phosphoribosylformylglycinamidine synthase subunit PurS [Desulfobacterales bacterium]
MPHRLEITLKPDLFDAEGEGIRRKADHYFGISLTGVRTIHVVTIDADLTPDQLETIRAEVFTNPVTQISSYEPLPTAFDWCVWVGYRPGVRDNPGATAVEAVEDVLGVKLAGGEGVYTSKRFCMAGPTLTGEDADKIAGELLANDIIQQWRIFSRGQWDPAEGAGFI